MRKLFRILIAVILTSSVAFTPLAFAAADAITQAEAETFIRSFYHALEGDDLDKVVAHFDQKVVYYSYGTRDRDFVAADLGEYCDTYASRSFTIGEVKLAPLPNAGGVTVKFDIKFFIRSPVKDITRYGRTHVDWDLAKRNGAIKIIRFDGSAAKEPAASPSP